MMQKLTKKIRHRIKLNKYAFNLILETFKTYKRKRTWAN